MTASARHIIDATSTAAYDCDVEKISEIIRRELINQPDSLRTLAERCEVDHTQLSRFMRGERGLSITAIDSICKALNMTLCVLPKRRRKA